MMKHLYLALVVAVGLVCSACQGGADRINNTPEVNTTRQVLFTPNSQVVINQGEMEQSGPEVVARHPEPFDITLLPEPSFEMLMAETEKELAKEIKLTPRGFVEPGKETSWYQFPWSGVTLVPGEYDGVARDATPPFGCNNNATNGDGDNGIEDIIAAYPTPASGAVSYVISDGQDLGWAKPNYFCSGGAGNDMYSAIYQLFADDEGSDPFEPNSVWLEISYLSGLLGGPVGPGGDCSAAEAYQVSGRFWKAFNSNHNASPSMNQTELYNILIAPSSEQSGQLMSSGNTVGRYQQFYFGDQQPPFDNAWIIGLESSTSPSDIFNDSVNMATAQGSWFFFNPLYGAHFARWQKAVLSGMSSPWETTLGWPVFGPIAYGSGVPILFPEGQCYVWGMWFERGFVWWVDYDNTGPSAQYPNARDAVILYRYTGVNVYESDGDYEALLPNLLYGGQGDLYGTVVVDSWRHQGADPWEPIDMLPTRDGYSVVLDGGTGEVTVAMYAQGCGGVPDVNGLYKFYEWDFGDSTSRGPGAPFDPAQAYANHTYDGVQSEYTVTVTITDVDDVTVDVLTFPIHVATQASGKAVLLMSQSHGYQQGWGGTNGWAGNYSFSIEANSVPIGEQRFPWAAGLATDSGIGPGPGTDLLIPTAPQNVIGLIDGRFGPDSYGAAERYSGLGSCGAVPITLDLGTATATQFCGIGYYGSLMAGNEASPAFRAGVSIDPPVTGFDIGFVSYGNLGAPDAGIGSGPSYSHQEGPGRLWVVGYPWAQTIVSSSVPFTMGRSQLLQNMIAWLNPQAFELSASPSILVINADLDANYPTNYQALLDDLIDLGASYTVLGYYPGIGQDYIDDGGFRCAIWYRGGPGEASGEPSPFVTEWTTNEIDDIINILD